MSRRILIVVDVNADDLEAAHATPDDIADGIAARLEEFYPVGGLPARGNVSVVAEVTKSYPFIGDALEVGLEGVDADWYGAAAVDEADELLLALRRGNDPEE